MILRDAWNHHPIFYQQSQERTPEKDQGGKYSCCLGLDTKSACTEVQRFVTLAPWTVSEKVGITLPFHRLHRGFIMSLPDQSTAFPRGKAPSLHSSLHLTFLLRAKNPRKGTAKEITWPSLPLQEWSRYGEKKSKLLHDWLTSATKAMIFCCLVTYHAETSATTNYPWSSLKASNIQQSHLEMR